MEAGYECVVAAPEVRAYQLVLHERPEGWHITRESPGYLFEADIAFADIKPEEYDGILISGGRAPVHPLRPGPQRRRALDAGPRSPGGLGLPRDRGPGHGGRDPGQARHLRPQVPVRRRGGRRHLRRGPGGGGRPPGHRPRRDGWLWMREYLRLLEQIERAPPGPGRRGAGLRPPVAPAGAV